MCSLSVFAVVAGTLAADSLSPVGLPFVGDAGEFPRPASYVFIPIVPFPSNVHIALGRQTLRFRLGFP